MKDTTLKKYSFIAVFVLVIALSYLILKPYFMYVLMALILLFAFRPLSRWLHEKIKIPWIASAVTLLVIMLLIITPAFIILKTFVSETTKAYSTLVTPENLITINNTFQDITGRDIDVASVLKTAVMELEKFILSQSLQTVNKVADILIGLFIMFFIMYFGFKHKDGPWKAIGDLVPLDTAHKQTIFTEIEAVTGAVIFGQAIAAVIQGLIGGLFFFIFGIPNAVFWGLVMAMFSFVPFLGTPIVWLPAGILELLAGNTTGGIIFLLLNAIITTNVDNIIKPYVISSRTKLHPVIVVIGVFGGISAFGFAGILIGPIILAVLIIFLEEYLGVKPAPLVVKKPMHRIVREWIERRTQRAKQ